jgi:tripartite-type tricarboxylate transporter receptor subunit TctC
LRTKRVDFRHQSGLKFGQLHLCSTLVAQHELPAWLGAAPDLPPVAEKWPGFEVHSWTALFAPARTPQSVLDRLNAAVREVWDQVEVQKRLRDLSVDPAARPAAELADFVAGETEKWRGVVREANEKPE